MSPEATTPRPRQVTLAASLVIAGSLLLVASVFERLATLRSLDTRTAVQDFLSQPPGSDLGLGLESVLDLLRLVALVGAALATAAAILGWHVLKRNQGARIALAVLAVPLFLAGTAVGGFLAALVAASIAMLWLPPAREWFTGRPATPRPDPTSARPPGATVPPPAPAPPPVRPAAGTPPPWTGYGDPGSWPRPAPYAAPQPGHQRRVERPGAVVAACVITWSCCALAAMFGLLLVMVLSLDAEGLFTELHRQNPQLSQDVSDSTLESTAWVSGIVAVVWSVASSVLAVLVYRRVRWAAYSLVVSAGLVALMCLGASLVSPVLAVPGLLGAATAVLLLQSGAQRWLAPRDQSSSRSGVM